MARFLGLGRPWLRVQTRDAERGTQPGITILEATEMAERTKAPKDGVYFLGQGRFLVRAGEPLPPGAKFVAADDVKAEQAATKTRGRQARPLTATAPQPAETTQAAGPAETATVATDTEPAKDKDQK